LRKFKRREFFGKINFFVSCVNVKSVPGTATLVEQHREEFDTGKDVVLDNVDPYTVAALLKLYLRELPERKSPEKMRTDFFSHFDLRLV
jgi:hypothetical protein